MLPARRRRLRYLATVFLLAATGSVGSAQEAQKKLEKLAADLPVLATREVLVYDRGAYVDWGRFQIPPQWGTVHRQCLESLAAAKLPERDLLNLLAHKDPKVRTLALVDLFARGEPKHLPHIYKLVNDKAATFPEPEPDLRADFRMKFDPVKDPIKVRPQTVGDVATVAIGAYLKAAGIQIPLVKNKPDVSAFEKYWAARKERTGCLSWFVLRLERATQLMSPVRAPRLALIQGLRQDIDLLPEADRAWTLLALAGGAREEHLRHLARPEELVKLGQRLGPAKLLDLLAGKKISDDPDLALPLARWHYWTMQTFVLQHATAFFDKDGSDKLLAIRRANPEGVSSPWWHIAAAELRPDRAMTILSAAMKEGNDKYQSRQRAELAAAAWRLAGTAQSKFVRDWFYTEPADPGHEPHHVLLESVFKDRPKENRSLLAELVKDPRFEQTDWHTLRHLIEGLNRWTKEPILTPEEMRDLQHPTGSYHFVLDLPGHRAKHPQETARVLKTLADWRQRVRDSVPQWSQPP